MNLLENFYETVDILKENKNGQVSLVYDKTGKQICVLKERSLQIAEIYRRLKKIKNFCVPEIFRIVELDGKIFVIEEFIEGQTLAEILNYKQLDEKIVAKILKQICEGLKILHEEKIIHRDLKPSNIMLTKNNSVKLIDFSISRILKTDSESDTDFLGTRGYAPPEQFGFGQTDQRSDIYSLGVTMQKVLGENYNGYLKNILLKCTQLDPTNRYKSVDEISADIDKKYFRYKFQKILLETIKILAIVLAVLFFPTKLNEQPEEKIIEEKVVEPKNEKISTEEKSEIKQPTFQFPEIKIPEAKTESTQPILKIPKNSPEKNESDPRLNQICTIYLNDKIFNNEVPAEVWQKWRHDGDMFYFPSDWKITLNIENKNNFALTNTKITVFLNQEEKIFSETITKNQVKSFTIPIGNLPLKNGSFKIEIWVNYRDNIFSWKNGNTFGNYREFQIYLIDYNKWRYENRKKLNL